MLQINALQHPSSSGFACRQCSLPKRTTVTHVSRPMTVNKRRILFILAGSGIVAYDASWASNALAELPADAIARAIAEDIQQRQAYVTGNVSKELYSSDFLFKDPTVTAQGIESYCKAVGTLFSSDSRVDLISIKVISPNTIVAKWRLEGGIKPLFGKRFKPYSGTTTYTLNDAGLITRHEETWDLPAWDVFLSTFIDGIGAPPAPPVATF